MTVTTTALYRRYRPDSFADVIGQEHVTEPLMTALRKNRVNHAYLFSGPRGCGKTTSARILARCLNCAQGPTDTPCGTCPSCIELARGGSGSLDVIEIDAASHGGVDDARDLRERATYAPVRDRYKIFIIDEAHMVTSAGFNALLKIVEEPPEHIKFIFATTEPDKVIGTIRSRTHHYPFRLVPPEPLMAYLELLCNQENVPVAPGVLSLVVRAGGGSVRDSLSVLDQLMAGAGPNGLDYELAVALLGYTHASLLDDVVEAVAASDAATVFRAVDRVVQTGHDPRRFVEDLLERFRDLIIVQAMPESAQVILRGMPADQIARLQNQAHNLGASELSRAADVTNTALTEMTGATSPRLHLELLCARILLPSSEQTERGIAARIDRVERRLNYAGNDVGAPAPAGAAVSAGPAAVSAVPTAATPAPAAPVSVPAASAPAPAAPVSVQPVSAPAVSEAPAAAPVAAQLPSGPAAAGPGSARPQVSGAEQTRPSLTPPKVSTNDWPVDESTGRPPAPTPQASGQPTRETGADAPRTVSPATPPASTDAVTAPATAAPAPAAPASVGHAPATAAPTGATGTGAASTGAAGTGDVEVLRRAWPEVLQTLSKIKRSTWALVEPNAQVGAFDGQVLTLSFSTTGLAGAFGRADHAENLRQAIHKTVGIDCQITAVAGGANRAASAEPNPKAPASPEASPEAPASSADVAWGLAPASAVSTPDVLATAPAPSPAPSSATRAPEPAVPPATAAPAPTAGAAAIAETVQHTGDVSASAATEAAQGQPVPAEPDATAGSYAYSDNDWGPPRDEDAPPLDEEPPMDWDPSAAAAPRLSPSQPEPSAAAPAKRPARGASKAAAAKTSPASRSSGAASAAPSQPDPALDPWGRAVEQAPGVWVVGTEPNVGKSLNTSVPEEAAETAPAPSYEPATAQVPKTSAVVSQSDADASWGLPPVAPTATTEIPALYSAAQHSAAPQSSAPETPALQGPAPESAAPNNPAPASQAPAVPPVEAAVPEPAEVREYAMASTAPAAAPLQPAPATSESAAAARQSLYQRLSNSPEAEAGRAKAPARAAAATYVQDIPSADDETIEESGVFGRAAVERILGGKLIEERSPDGSPIVARF
ncbi:DNA polymerase III subunit gamma and tau [Pseudarthrobacter raffinosi]|uniref:DNA polymerase III subunit gamma and tau n=1 Tax=Pseudarthrobacter raffinosi TaxID=2953651 RepID=UPI00208F1246|nr:MULTISPECIES: DNA polymerase III subunit gamma and tau [unclassified Pseudarthrobacter]MCO4251992.1 DNA polymerase III subunit gamma and tau [Pseudarthrobacter sp. MDT3-9]MCO4262862.1 DNA polymerase III subunit gamma and tau [Pseudarthrobacter sp. MDT3-26]